MEIYNSPEYLILHLKRFKTHARTSGWSNRVYGSRRKDSQTIYFPLSNLDMTEYVLNPYDTIEMFEKRPQWEDEGMDAEDIKKARAVFKKD